MTDKKKSKKYVENRENFHLKHPIAQVAFETKDENELGIYIDTPRLHLENVRAKDAGDLFKFLYNDPEVMKTMAAGNTRPIEDVNKTVNMWHERAKANSPFVGFKAEKNEGEEFVGLVVLGASELDNRSELVFMAATAQQNKGYTSEAVGAIVYDYAPEVFDAPYRLPNNQPFEWMVGTALTTNDKSNAIFDHLGFEHYKTEEKFGTIRNFYELKIVGDNEVGYEGE